MAAQLTHTPFARSDAAHESVPSQIARLWRRYLAYRQTQAQLRALSIREREDIGLAGEDMDAVAREAFYRR